MKTKTNSVRQKINRHLYMAVLSVLMLMPASKAIAQSELGVVWTKEYNIPNGLKGVATGFNVQPLYYAQTGQSRYLITGTEDSRTGFIAMIDESGNILKYWSIPIPAYYNKYPVVPVQTKAAELGTTYPDVSFASTVSGLYGTYYINDILASKITTALIKKDGSILAFGTVVRYRSDAWKAPGDAVTDYSPGSHSDTRMLQGVWKITISADGQTVTSETARGAEAFNIFPYDNKILLTGLDIHTTGQIGAAGKGVGMLHEYDLNGNFVAERCPADKDGVPITGASMYLDGKILLHGWSGTAAIKIDPNNPNVTLGSYDAKTINTNAINYPMAGNPTVDGGGFFNPVFTRTNYPGGTTIGGTTFAKLNSNGTLAYKILDSPSDRSTVYDNPLILDKNKKKYVGTVNKNGKNYIYELEDKGTTYTLNVGDPYPNNTSLRVVGLQDGFFAMGMDPVTRKTSIVKLSTCANFKLDIGGSSDVTMLSEKTFPSRIIKHTGNKGTVTYKWTLTDITNGGNAIDGWSGIITSGNTNTIPAQQFKLANGKEFAVLQYTITAIDSYNISGVPQTCQQTYNIQVKIYRTLPDNIIVDQSSCLIPFDTIDFKIKQKWSQPYQGQQNTGILVGDLDGDKQAEIIAYAPTLNKINIYDGTNNGAIKATINLSGGAHGSGGWHPTMTALLVDADRNGMGEVIVANPNKTLESYEADTTGGTFKMKKKWPLSGTVTFDNPTAADNIPQPIVADLNGDGVPELIVYNKIYNAATGAYLGQTEAIASANVGRVPLRVGNRATNFMTTADFDGDGLPEIVAGGKVYKVTFAGDKKSVTCTKLYENTSIGDGFTAVADIDMDGKLDVIVTNVPGSGQTWLHIWSPIDNRMIDSFHVYTNTGYPAQSYPFVGDIDGKKDDITGEKHPEICLTIVSNVVAYKYNSTTKKMVKKWTLGTTDASGGTGITLFDFNNDGIQELVYRDQTKLRILDGRLDNTVPTLSDAGATIDCASGTAFEYPVIADIDGDGSANICVTCAAGYGVTPDYLRVYESGSKPWAPTRQVWNQVNYEPTQINNDLTVPTSTIPKNTKFEVNGVVHSPYNGTLIQVPITNINMEPVIEAPDPFVVKLNGVFKNDTIVKISVTIANQGQKYVNSSLPISLYKSGLFGTADLLVTKPINTALAPGKSVEIDLMEVHIKNLESSYAVRIQDDGTTYPAPGSYLDCNMDNNTVVTSNLFANDDYLLSFINKENDLKVTINDVIPLSCTSPSVTVVSGPKHGIASGAGTVIKYTPAADYQGQDTLQYEVMCGTNKSTAFVYITIVPQPDNISDANCYVDAPSTNLLPEEKNKTDKIVHILAQPFVGNVDKEEGLEVVTTNMHGSGYATSNSIMIFDKDLRLKKEIITPVMRSNTTTPLALVRIKPEDEYALIIIATYQNGGTTNEHYKLQAYTSDGTLKWTSDKGIYRTDTDNTTRSNATVSPVIADINGDGYPEVLAGDRIFDAETGNFLVELPKGGKGLRPLNASDPSNLTYMPVIADVDNDGILDVVGGNTIYKVDIKSRTNPSQNNASILKQVTGIGDGFTSVADIDMDGQVDVVTISMTSSYTPVLTVWNGATGEVIAGPKEPSIAGKGGSRVFIGDMNNDGAPEMAYSYEKRLVAYKYNPAASTTADKLAELWSEATSDNSAGTTLSMFDFDQDGNVELVYRDETHLRIINGITGKNKKTFPCFSATHSEYPIIVDFDRDGHADIIVSGADSQEKTNSEVYLKRYSGSLNDWAPARPVWNQHGYNNVHINNDLTVPKTQLNPGTVFPGKDTQIGTKDDVRPYNGFLMQQTSLSREGVPLYLTPNAIIPNNGADIKFDYNTDTDILTISDLKIWNDGDAVLQKPIKIAIYKNKVPSTTKYVYNWEDKVDVDETKTVPPFTVPNFSSFLPSDSISIRINDNGDGMNYQPVCDSCCVNNSSESFVNIPFDALGWADSYRKCPGQTVTLTGAPQSKLGNNVIYKWHNPKNTLIGTGREIISAPLALSDSGRYILRTEKVGSKQDLSLTFKLPFLSVAPDVLYWKTNTKDSNWNNPDNWNDKNGNSYKAVPSGCTMVHIPSGASYYPSLDTITTKRILYGNPEVGTIVYHYGGETAYPHLLTYEKAKVQYNFGYYNTMSPNQPTENKDGASAISMKRDQWYPLAAPLKKIASGDFSFGGYPYTWQALGDIISGDNNVYSVNFNKSHAANDVDLSTTNNSIVVKTALYKADANATGYHDHKHLQDLKGVLEIPYFDNPAESSSHPGHSYDQLAQRSTFYYFNDKTLQTLHSPVGKMSRSNDAFRFVFENNSNKVEYITKDSKKIACYTMKVSPNSTHKHALIGNPFMATINMKNFYEMNSQVLSNIGYYAYDNSGAGTWRNYAYTVGNGVNSLQAFVVVFTKNTADQTLYFPLEGDYALTGTATNKIPRRIEIPGALSVSISNEDGVGGDYAELSPNDVQNELDNNVRKLVNEENHITPEVFFVDHKNAGYNLMQVYNEGEKKVGLGIRCSDTKSDLTLTFDHINEFVQLTGENPILVDKHLGIEQDLSKKNTYTLRQRATSDNKELHTDATRLYIRFGEEASNSGNEDGINVAHRQNELVVNATSDEIVNVRVYNLLGQLLFDSGILKTKETYYRHSLNLLQQEGYIVRVKTDKKTVSKKIMTTN